MYLNVNTLLFFTSNCSSCQEDIKRYSNNITGANNFNKLPLWVFSVFLPTIPKTGFNNQYSFEEGKISLLRRVSNYIVSINSITGNNVVGQYADLSVPLFHLPDLGVDSREHWDIPQDLEKKRGQYLTLPTARKEDVEKASAKIAEEFEKFIRTIKPPKPRNNEKGYHVNVLASNSIPLSSNNILSNNSVSLNMMLLIILVLTLCLISSYLVYRVQYGDTTQNIWLNSNRHKYSEYFFGILGFYLILFIALVILYEGDNPLKAVSLGHVKLVLWVITNFGLCFFFAPLLIFKLHCIENFGKRLSIFIPIFIVILTNMCISLISNENIWLMAVLGMPLILFLLFGLFFIISAMLGRRRHAESKSDVLTTTGELVWFRKPWGATSIKILLGIPLSILFYIPLWSDPASLFSLWRLLLLNCSYSWFVLLIGGIFSGVGVIFLKRLKKEDILNLMHRLSLKLK